MLFGWIFHEKLTIILGKCEMEKVFLVKKWRKFLLTKKFARQTLSNFRKLLNSKFLKVFLLQEGKPFL